MEITKSNPQEKASLQVGMTPSQQQQIAEVNQKMAQVLDTMRDNYAKLPADPKISDDASVITHVEFIQEGGIFTYLQRYEKPFRGFPFNETVQQVDAFKKLAKIVIQRFYASYRGSSIWAKIKLFLSLDLMQALAIGYLHAHHWQIRPHRLKPHMYCQCVRELHTVISNNSRDIFYDDELREAIRDSICMFLEFDNAYRFRFQDIMMELDKHALNENPLKEILRLIDLMIEREKAEPGKVRMADKWKMARELMALYLRINKPVLNKIKTLLLRLNIKEIEFTPEDKYYCEFRKDYNFGFMSRGAIPQRPIPKGIALSLTPPQEEVSPILQKAPEVGQTN